MTFFFFHLFIRLASSTHKKNETNSGERLIKLHTTPGKPHLFSLKQAFFFPLFFNPRFLLNPSQSLQGKASYWMGNACYGGGKHAHTFAWLDAVLRLGTPLGRRSGIGRKVEMAHSEAVWRAALSGWPLSLRTWESWHGTLPRCGGNREAKKKPTALRLRFVGVLCCTCWIDRSQCIVDIHVVYSTSNPNHEDDMICCTEVIRGEVVSLREKKCILWK